MSGSRANPVEIKDDNTIEISDDENDVEVIDLLGDLNPSNDMGELELWLAGASYMVQHLEEDPDNQGTPGDLRDLLRSFDATIDSACEALADKNPATQPTYNDLLKGARAELQAWFSQHGRRRDVMRVSRKGLLKMYNVVKNHKERTGAMPHTFDHKDMLIEDLDKVARLPKMRNN